MSKKNYIDHDLEVKVMDNCINKEIDWTWFLDEIDETFDLKETYNWTEFDNQGRTISISLIKLIIEITKIDNIVFNTKNIIINDLIYVCKYYNEKISYNDLVINSNFCKLLFLLIYTAKKINANSLYETSLFSSYNAYKYKSYESLIEEKEYICIMIDELNFTDKNIIKSFFIDNINKVNHDYDKKYILDNTNRFINYNPFDFMGFKIESNTIYEFELLNEILSITLTLEKIIPTSEFNGISFPDFKKWNNDFLLSIKNYFNCKEVDFIIDTLRYYLDMNMPDEILVQQHLNLLKEAFNSEKNKHLILSSTSYIFVVKMFKSKDINKYSSINKKNLLMETANITDEYIISEFKNNDFPTSNDQNKILENSIKLGYESIDNIIDTNDLLSYMKNKNNSKNITVDKFKVLKIKFREIVSKITDISIGTMFIEYMDFLFDLNNNTNIGKDELNKEENNLARMWTNDYCKKAENMLQSINSSVEIPNESINEINNIVIFNPKKIADICMITSEEDILKQMIISSENCISLLVPNITIDGIFPYKKVVSYKEGSLDSELETIIERISKNKGYKLLNRLNSNTYIEDIYNAMQVNVIFYMSLITCENEIYKKIQELSTYKLADIVEGINFSHMAGLFPVLEIEIRKLCLYFDICPIKEDKKYSIQYNDSSTLLKELLDLSYINVETFEQFNDLYFVYNCMYNHNFLNIRNEFIHGKRYLDGYMLKFAFKITVLCLYMVLLRNRYLEKLEKK